MSQRDNKIFTFYKKHQSHIKLIEGLLIVLLLFLIWNVYSKNVDISKEISKNCGWAEEDYECYCQKSDVIAQKNVVEGKFDLGVVYDPLDN